jgi:NTP pyrophosphatase (non-canonical NTP hydrolase)
MQNENADSRSTSSKLSQPRTNDANDFQRWCVSRMCRPTDPTSDIMLYTLGLAGEAGEVADAVKKMILHGTGIDPGIIRKELGDVLFYAVTIAAMLRIPASELMEACVAKINKRYPDGFDPQRSHRPGETPIEEQNAGS